MIEFGPCRLEMRRSTILPRKVKIAGELASCRKKIVPNGSLYRPCQSAMRRKSSQRHHLLASQILDTIRNGRFEIGHHLREQALGDLLQVSRTPIRGALQLLAERGVVEARRNQGYFLMASSQELSQVELNAPATGGRDLYDAIVGDRLAGDLPDLVTQSDLLRIYATDRVTLQRILSRMVDDGLIIRNTGRGWSFLPTLDTGIGLQASYAFRRAIEPAALMMPEFRVDASAVERSRLQHLYLVGHPSIETVTLSHLFETDAQFHEMLAEFSGNPFLLQAIQQQNRLRRLLEFGGYLNRRRVRDWCREHLAILDAVALGDHAKAAQLMERHLSNALKAVPQFRGLPRPLPVESESVT